MGDGRLRWAALLIGGLTATAAVAEPVVSPPTLNCARGFEGLRTSIQALEGAQWSIEDGADVATFSLADKWRAHIAFTTPAHPAHPAVTMRTFRHQVTGVWTADSKGCGYGDPARFSDLMAAMKVRDTELTNASRAEAERAKAGQSPLAPLP